MQITKDKAVSMNYVLKDNDGNLIDSSEGSTPLAYLHGAGNIIVGLERELEGKVKGDKIKTTIAPKDGYGLRDETGVQIIPRSQFEAEVDISQGMQFEVESPDGVQVVTVTEVDNEKVTVDANHPLAGTTLNFDVEVLDVRDATKEELEHGHIHGEHGHHH